jgi:hypothetical protein
MSQSLPEWPVSHFAQANPVGPGQDDVPTLLRRVADSIEKLGSVDVRDITFHNDFDPGGDPYLHMVVYYTRATRDSVHLVRDDESP